MNISELAITDWSSHKATKMVSQYSIISQHVAQEVGKVTFNRKPKTDFIKSMRICRNVEDSPTKLSFIGGIFKPLTFIHGKKRRRNNRR